MIIYRGREELRQREKRSEREREGKGEGGKGDEQMRGREGLINVGGVLSEEIAMIQSPFSQSHARSDTCTELNPPEKGAGPPSGAPTKLPDMLHPVLNRALLTG